MTRGWRRQLAVSGATLVGATALVFGVGASAIQALMPVVARESGGGTLVFGMLLGSFGVGAVGGALFVGRLRAKYETETIVRVAALAFATAALGLAYAPWLVVTLPALMIAGAVISGAGPMTREARLKAPMRAIRPRMRGDRARDRETVSLLPSIEHEMQR